MNNDDLSRRLLGKEIAKRDQSEANRETLRRQQEAESLILTHARESFAVLQQLAEKIIIDVNKNLEGEKYRAYAAPGGFCLSLGREIAGFSYSQVYANSGPILMSITIARQPSNLAAFGIAEDRTASPGSRWALQPAWNWATNAIAWKRGNDAPLSSETLLEDVMHKLMERAD